VKASGIGRIAGILGAVLALLVGSINIVLGVTGSSPEQSGNSLVVRGALMVVISIVAGGAVQLSYRKAGLASSILVLAIVLGFAVAFRNFWFPGVVLLVSATFIYHGRSSDSSGQ
jgi:chromate transport protein ChrA